MKLAKRLIGTVAAMAMSATAFTLMISASALEGVGTHTGSLAYIGTYFKSDYFGNTAFQVKYKYDKFDEDGTYVDPDTNEVVTIDYNDTFEFFVFDSEWGGWDKTSVGPNGIDVTEPVLTAKDLNTATVYTTTVPIATIERELKTEKPVQGINLQLGGVGDTIVTIESIEYVQCEDITLIENAGPFTGDATPISTYYRSLYSNKSKLEIKFKYDVLYSTRTDSSDKKVLVNFNDTFEFEVFDTTLNERKSIKVGPKGVDRETYITPDFEKTYTVTIPISNLENMLSGTPYFIRLKTGYIGDSQVSIVSLKLID